MLCNRYAGHALTADRWNIFLIDVLFVHHLQGLEQEALEQETDHLDNHLDHIYLKSTNPSAKITTMEAATTHTAITPTNVTAVEMTTRSGAAHSMGSPGLVKPLPWTPIWSFILERELSNYPKKAFSLIIYNTAVQLATQNLCLLTLLIIYVGLLFDVALVQKIPFAIPLYVTQF